MKEIICILLKSQQMVLAENDAENDGAAHIVCEKPLLLNWGQDKTVTLIMGLSSYPLFITHIIKRAGERSLPIPRSDIVHIYSECDIKDEAISAYKNRSQQVYGTIDVIHRMPGNLTGRA